MMLCCLLQTQTECFESDWLSAQLQNLPIEDWLYLLQANHYSKWFMSTL